MNTKADTLPKAATPKKVTKVPQSVMDIRPDMPRAPEALAARAKLDKLNAAQIERRRMRRRLERRQADLSRNIGDAIANGTPTAKLLAEVVANDAEINRLNVENVAIKEGERTYSSKLYHDLNAKSPDLPAWSRERRRIDKAWKTINEEASAQFGDYIIGAVKRWPGEAEKIEAKNAWLDAERLRLAQDVEDGRFK